jgi:hypothetical protein
MAVVMQMRWAGVTPQQYDQVRDAVGWETDVPAGGISHVAWFEDDDLHVVDAWESPDQFQAFVDQRLMPGVAQVGVQGQPEVTIQPAHRVFDAAHAEVHA